VDELVVSIPNQYTAHRNNYRSHACVRITEHELTPVSRRSRSAAGKVTVGLVICYIDFILCRKWKLKQRKIKRTFALFLVVIAKHMYCIRYSMSVVGPIWRRITIQLSKTTPGSTPEMTVDNVGRQYWHGDASVYRPLLAFTTWQITSFYVRLITVRNGVVSAVSKIAIDCGVWLWLPWWWGMRCVVEMSWQWTWRRLSSVGGWTPGQVGSRASECALSTSRTPCCRWRTQQRTQRHHQHDRTELIFTS